MTDGRQWPNPNESWVPEKPPARAPMDDRHVEKQCTARKPDAPQQGERCSMLPHASWMPHSWVPWSVAVKQQAENRRAQEVRLPASLEAVRAEALRGAADALQALHPEYTEYPASAELRKMAEELDT